MRCCSSRWPVHTAMFVILLSAGVGRAAEANYDESRVPKYTLPDLLTLKDGQRVADADAWRARRRPEVLRMFEELMFGRSPGKPAGLSWKVFDEESQALGGKAVRKQVAISFTGKADGPGMDLLIYLPRNAGPRVPVFLVPNFQGNHAIHADPGIKLSDRWVGANYRGVVDHRATDASRGGEQSRFPVEKILARGYGLATVYYGDIDPDFDDGFRNGVHPAFDKPGEKRPPDAWGSIAAWAWGLSRALDYLETDPNVDARRVIVMGHSRLGKTALWAGATDERFAIVISNDSGCGGAALSRRCYGETVERINTVFPHWFCENYRKYNGREADAPFDQHMLIALMAPRPVYVASAEQDKWADPRGEFLSAKDAEPVYRLFGVEGLPTEDMPAVDCPVQGTIGYHIRTGKHDVTDYDWQQYMDFADKHFKKRPD